MSASEMTMQAKRDYVEKVWSNVRYDGNRVLADGYISGMTLILSGNSNCMFEWSKHLDEGPAWDAAYAFTKERERKIAVMECRLLFMQDVKQDAVASDYELCDGIIDMIQAALQEMRRGMRKEGQ